MMGLICKRAIRYYHIGWNVSMNLAFLYFLLLADHYQRKLTRRLPILFLLQYLFSV
jgi:hypothetical protein